MPTQDLKDLFALQLPDEPAQSPRFPDRPNLAALNLFDRPPAGLPDTIPQAEALQKVISPTGRELLDEREGYIIGSRGYALLRLQPDGHMVTIAKSGAGKGSSVIIPNLVDHEGSVISVEIGGSNYRESVNYRKHELGQQVVLLDPFGQTGEKCDSLNLLDTFDQRSPTFYQEVKYFSDSIISHGNQSTSGHADQHTPASLLRSLILHVLTNPAVPQEDRNLVHIMGLLGSYGSTQWTDLMKSLSTDTGKYRLDLNSIGNYFSGQDTESKARIALSALQLFGFPGDPSLQSVLKTSTFDLRDIGRKKVSLYIIMPNMEMYGAMSGWLRGVLERTFQTIPDRADATSSLRHRERVLCVLDEFTLLGRLECVANGMDRLHRKGVTLWPCFQSIPGLSAIYGEEKSSQFLSTATCVQVFNVTDKRTLEYISERCGDTVVQIPSATHGVNSSTTKRKDWARTVEIGTEDGISDTKYSSTSEIWERSSSSGNGTEQTTEQGSEKSREKSRDVTRTLEGHPMLFMDMRFGKSTEFNKGTASGNSTYQSQAHAINNYSTQSSSSGGQKLEGESTTKSHVDIFNDARTKGWGQDETYGRTYAVTYTAHIIKGFPIAYAEQQLAMDRQQFLLINGNHKRSPIFLRLLEGRPSYTQHPVLIARAKGPHVIGAPLLAPVSEPPVIYEIPPATASIEILDFAKDDEMAYPGFELHDLATYGNSMRYWLEGEVSRRHDLPSVERAAQNAEKSENLQALVKAQTFMQSATVYVNNYQAYLGKMRSEMEARAWLIGQRLDALTDTHQKVYAYRDELVHDHDHVEVYRREEARYMNYLSTLYDLRSRWHAIRVPQRPGQLEYEGLPSETVDEATMSASLRTAKITHKIPDPPTMSAMNQTLFVTPPSGSARLTGPSLIPKLSAERIDGESADEIQKQAQPAREMTRLAAAFAIVAATTWFHHYQDVRIGTTPGLMYETPVSTMTSLKCSFNVFCSAEDKSAIAARNHNREVRSRISGANFMQTASKVVAGIILLCMSTGIIRTLRSRKLETAYRESIKDGFDKIRKAQGDILIGHKRNHETLIKNLATLRDDAARMRRENAQMDAIDFAIDTVHDQLLKTRDVDLERLKTLLEARRIGLSDELREATIWDRLEAQTSQLNAEGGTTENTQEEPDEPPPSSSVYDGMQAFEGDVRLRFRPTP